MKKNPFSNLRKLASASLVAAPMLAVTASAWAATTPGIATCVTGLTLPASGVTVSSAGNSVAISVASSTNTVLYWSQFNVLTNESLSITLPTANSAVLNKVTGGSSTTIDGIITSNGKVFVQNPAGITITSNAVINAASFVASALDDSDAVSYFQANNDLSYSGTGSGTVSVTGGNFITVGGTGSVVLAGNGVTVNGGTYNGSLTLKGSNVGNAVSIASSSATTVTGDLNVASYGGSVTLTGTAALTVGGNLTVAANGYFANGAVSSGTGLLSVATSGKVTSIDTTGIYGWTSSSVTLLNTNLDTVKIKAVSATIAEADDIVIGDSTVTTLSLVSAAGSITTSGTASISSAFLSAAHTTSSALDKSISLKTAGGVTLLGGTQVINGTTYTGLLASNVTVSAAGNVTLPAVSGIAGSTAATTITAAATSGSVAVGGAYNVTGGSLYLSATKDSTIASAITGSVVSVSLATGKLTVNAAVNGASSVSLTSSGDLTVANTIASPSIALTSTAGNITETTSGLVNAHSYNGSAYVGYASLTAAKGIDLSAGANVIDYVKLVNSDSTSAVKLNSSITNTSLTGITVATGTSTVGATTITSNGAVILGATTSDSIKFAGVANLTGTSILDVATAVTYGSDLNVIAGNVVLDGIASVAGSIYGTVTGNATFASTSGSINLGGVSNSLSVGGNLAAYGATSIGSNGAVVVAGTTSLAAGTVAAPGSISLTSTSNALSGAITLGAYNSTVGVAGAVTLTNSIATNLGASTVATSLTVNSTGAVTQSGALVVPTATFNVPSSTVVLANTSNSISTITVNSAGAGIVNAGDITVNGAQTGAFTVTTVAGNVVLGTLTDTANIAIDVSATAGKTITDSVMGGLTITGDIALYTQDGAISITKQLSGGNFGGITAITTKNDTSATPVGANVTFTESGVSRFVDVETGTSNFTSTAGSGILVRDSGNILKVGGTTTLTSGGYVNIASAPTVNLTGLVNVTAGADITVYADSALTVGNISTSFVNTNTTSAATFALTLASATSVIEDSSSKIVVAGDVSVTAGTSITLLGVNGGNQFGKLALVAGGDISIYESTTMNLEKVSTATNFTANSGADIIQTSLASSLLTNSIVSVGGSAAIAANNITLSNTSNVLNTVRFLSAGNTSIASVNNLILAGNSYAGGTFTARVSNANGSITDAGVITVVGNATFAVANNTSATLTVATSGTISLTNPNSNYGNVTFLTNTLTYAEKGSIVLAGGSYVTGNAIIESTGADISVIGASTFKGTVRLNAATNVVFSKAVQIDGLLTIVAGGNVDLSVLSLYANLNNTAPSVTAGGTYTKYTSP